MTKNKINYIIYINYNNCNSYISYNNLKIYNNYNNKIVIIAIIIIIL